MNNDAKKSEYPYSKSRIYLSVVLAVLSIVLALPLLPTPVLILYYLASTFVIATIVFILKRRYFYTKKTETHQGAANENSEKRISWKLLILLFSGIITIMVFPLFLAGAHPYAWFILMISLTSGISISEIVLYVYMR